jgi:predicted protein tyrosine phosphatase
MNVLIVCTHHVARSPMAAAVFNDLAGASSRHRVHSVGLAADASRRLTTRELAWADTVVVMEPTHQALIARRWPQQGAKVRVLDVPDDYDPERTRPAGIAHAEALRPPRRARCYVPAAFLTGAGASHRLCRRLPPSHAGQTPALLTCQEGAHTFHWRSWWSVPPLIESLL